MFRVPVGPSFTVSPDLSIVANRDARDPLRVPVGGAPYTQVSLNVNRKMKRFIKPFDQFVLVRVIYFG
jgi:hypothetical protein